MTQDLLPEEEQGMIATLKMHKHICKSDEEHGVDETALAQAHLMEQFSLGELSRRASAVPHRIGPCNRRVGYQVARYASPCCAIVSW